MNPEVVVVGEAMALMLASNGLPLNQASTFEQSIAGAESNVAIGLSRLGHRVAFAGRVGEDAAGSWVRDALRREGVDVSALSADPLKRTGMLLRDWAGESRPSVVNYYRENSAASAIGRAQISVQSVRGARAIFVSGITVMLSAASRDAVSHLFDTAEQAGVPVYFDPNIRLRLAPLYEWRRSVVPFISRASTILVGRDELALLDLDTDGASFLSDTTKVVVVKDGESGARIYSRDESFTQQARSVRVVDVVGAGDAFTAGWVAGTLRGLGLRDAAHVAAIVASLVVATPGDVAGLPSWAEVNTILEKGQEIAR
jgi:2-dehydro-3-deoxygluconokinase